MRIVIAGAGALGTRVLQDLSESGSHELVVVESDEARAEDIADQFDALVIHGDAADVDILEKAQIDRADALVALTGSDPINTVIAMLGHRKQVEVIVVKLTTNSLRGALEEIGVTDIVAPTMAAAARIGAALHGAGGIDLADLVQGHLQIAQIAVGPMASGRRIDELEVPEEVVLVAVVHGDGASLPHRVSELEEGDVVVAVAESDDALDRCRAAFDGS